MLGWTQDGEDLPLQILYGRKGEHDASSSEERGEHSGGEDEEEVEFIPV